MTCKFFLTVSTFILISASTFSQNGTNNYERSWKKIDSLIEKKGLPQSALEEINKIYASAKKEKNNAQIIKTLIYKLSLEQVRSDEANGISQLEKEIAVAAEPAKSILLSLEAESYWNYFQQHRYQFYNRTETINFKKDDIATWGISDFHKKISELYLASIHDEKILKQTRLESFDAVIIKGNVRYLRPTLYDLLAHRALEYFKNDEMDINKPSYAFELNDSTVFAERNVFISYHFTTKDSLSLHFKALILFQQLIQWHMSDLKPDAMLDVDIERLEFAQQYAIMENKEELFATALKRLTNQYDTHPIAAQAWFLQAQQYANKADQYNALTDTSNRYAYLEAKNICEHVLKQADSSEGKTNCTNLLRQILSKELSIQTENVNIPGQPFRTLLSYKNISEIYWRIISIDKRTKESLGADRWRDEYWKKLAGLSATKTYTQVLPDTKDYQRHSVEIKTDGLEPGEYILLASVDKDFRPEKNYMAVESFNVSNIAYIINAGDYFVLNRETGQPLQATDVQVWYQVYEPRESKYVQRKGENFNTDKNGFFHLTSPKTRNNNQIQLEFKRDNDHLLIGNERLYNEYYEGDQMDNGALNKNDFETKHRRTFFFTDRSIYRPGQTIYFKGISVTMLFESKRYQILSDFKTKVILYNANGEKVDSVLVTTNEFGSYHGSFKLPESQLNGEFRIEDETTKSDQSFSVEEYKRPKFDVAFDTIKGSYRVNDTIKVTGIAKAYAGNLINDALVKYRVVRYARIPYPYYKIGIWRPSREQEITHGETKTDANGKFVIDFIAIPDIDFKKESNPVFDYNVVADVTDINGETHNAESQVRVSYKSLQLSVEVPLGDNQSSDSLKYLFVSSENLSGQFQATKVNISIYQLASPGRLIRQRYWQQPDQFVMTKEEYLKYFPFDEYSGETKKENWQRLAKVFELSETTNQQKKIQLKGSSFKPGWYLIEAIAKDKYGEEVKDIKYVQLFDNKTGAPVAPDYNWITNSTQTVQPGNSAIVSIGSSAKDVFVIQQDPSKHDEIKTSYSSDNDQHEKYNFLNLNNEKKSVTIPVTETDRGGFGISYAFVKNNRLFLSNHSVVVPWNNKQLSINYETYRDQTLPGSEEKWKIKIAGYKKDKVAAEVVAAMYDASLDQFKPHSWTYPNIYSTNIPTVRWSGQNNFYYTTSEQKSWIEDGYISFAKNYDFILHVTPYRNVPIRMAKSANDNALPAPQSLAGQAPGLDVVAARADTSTFESEEMYVMGEKLKKTQDVNQTDNGQIQIRKNFSETAFFFPDLKTDSSGNVEFSFTMPEALTKWKWMTFAHTKDLSMGYEEKSVITQKQLMVQPNAPRFLREGDKMEFSTKIVNMTDSALSGLVTLHLIDPSTNQKADRVFNNITATKNFSVKAGQSISVSFPIEIPNGYTQGLTYQFVATANKVSDGEEATLPVLSNRTLVTESMPINMNSTGTKKFRFEKLLQSGESKTLTNQSLTVEFTSNPAWYAVQALPYLMEYPYECSEQSFNRFYSNALASMIANSSPRIKEVFERWKNVDTAALLSNLQKNEELKSVLLEETPWVLAAKNESAQKRNIALLFDMLRMNAALESSFSKMQNMQLENGGFSWFKDGPDDRYITQYILTGIGHLKKLNASPSAFANKIKTVVTAAIAYLDKKIKADYDDLQKRKKKTPQLNELGNIQIQYLYMRSFFSEYPIPGDVFPAINYYRKQSQQQWLHQSRYMQGMIALSLFRTGDIKTATDILASLKQNAIVDEEMGMYWKDIRSGYYWYESPIETQCLLTEAFIEIKKDNKITNDLKTWILKQKQTQNWSTTKATADACYVLLMQGTNLLSENNDVKIVLGNDVIDSKNQNSEAGTGYFKKIISSDSVSPSMGNVTVSLSSPTFGRRRLAEGEAGGGRVGAAWGAVYWQYFENLDKITSSSSTKMPLTLTKKLFVERNSDRGPVLEPVGNNASLKIGDKIKVRIELRVDRDMEYVHMKDMRAAASEPVNVISKYNWQGGLGYYETTKDASTNFFFSWLPKGTHVFEYALFVTTAGDFSNGITSIQCMYAPEFSAHSDGIRITVH